jgi:hypothetical protein
MVDKDSFIKEYYKHLYLKVFMKELFTTPYKKKSASKAPAGAREQAYSTKQKILAVNSVLESAEELADLDLKYHSASSKPASEIVENISRNISRIDHNLYSARNDLEKLTRLNSTRDNIVSLS